MTQSELNFLKLIGKNIANRRKKMGLSQNMLGAEINMEKSNLSAIENGRQNVTALTLKKIADALSCAPIDFFKQPH